MVLRHTTTILAEPGSYGVEAFHGFFMFGRAGVEFFFVLSGFIIAYVHAGDVGRPGSFAGFWRKRLLRIYPPYWIATAILGAILVFSPTRDRAEQDPVHVVLSLLLLPETQEPVLGVGWSLRHEMVFYLLFGLLLLNRRLGLAALGAWAAAILACFAYRGVTGQALVPGAVGGVVFRFFDIQFFFGMGVAVLVRRWPGWRPVPVLIAGAVLFLAVGMSESFGPPVRAEWPPRVLAYALGGAMMLYGVAVLDRRGVRYVPRALVALGASSYSLYLLHVTVIMVVAFALRLINHAVPLPLTLSFVACVAAALVSGVVFSLVVERPVLRLGRRAGRLPVGVSEATARR